MTPEQKEHVKEWIVALRSGKYQQAIGKLFDGTGYCCLGVGCIVAGKNFTYHAGNIWLCENRSQVLPEDVMKYFGIKTEQGRLKNGYLLTSRNDCGNSFSYIAATIEAELNDPHSSLFVSEDTIQAQPE